jgi:hypothetical protein
MADVSIRGNEIHINKNTFSELNLNLCDQLLDLDKPVSVIIDDRVVFRKKLKRSLESIRSAIREYQDPTMVFSAKLIVTGGQVRLAKF